MRLFCLILNVIIYKIGFSQNLVSNSSFEDYDNCPKSYMEYIKKEITTDWINPTRGTPDYFNSCNRNCVGVPKNLGGNQFAHSGNAYVGIVFLKKQEATMISREYIENELKEKMEKGHFYCVKYFVNMADYSKYATNGFGAIATKKKLKKRTQGILKTKPQFISDRIVEDSINWTCISGIIKSDGDEKYITFGIFEPDETIQFRERKLNFNKNVLGKGNQTGYFYIDDVSLTEISDSSECSCNEIQAENKDSLPELKTGNGTAKLPKKEIVLKNVFFDTDQSELLPASYKELDELVLRLLKDNPEAKIEISGHTDNSGTEAHNLELSTARAKAVADYLQSKGIAPHRISHKGYGSSKPLAPNDSEEHKAMNRRVEFLMKDGR